MAKVTMLNMAGAEAGQIELKRRDLRSDSQRIRSSRSS